MNLSLNLSLNLSRRRFLGQSTLLTAAPVIGVGSQQHLALLGDSIFDNGSYVAGKPDVIAQRRRPTRQNHSPG